MIDQKNKLTEQVNDLNRMIANRQIMETFETYYADGVVMREVGLEARIGKAANRNYKQALVDGLKGISIQVKGVAVDEDTGRVFVKAGYDFEHQQWGHLTYDQVAPRWENGEIEQIKY